MTTESGRDPFAGLPEIFADAVDREGTILRHDLRYPVVDGDYVYATDAHLMVRATVDGWTPPADRPRHPSGDVPPLPGARVAAKFAECEAVAYRAEPVDLPDVGGGMMDCDRCGGNGICCGCECEGCDGRGEVRDLTAVDLGGVMLSAYYVALLGRHGCRAYLPDLPTTGDEHHPVRFECRPGVVGFVMPAPAPARSEAPR